MKKILLLFGFISVYSFGYGQSYLTAAGLRLGTDWGLTVQQRLSKRLTVEGILQSSLSREEVMLTGVLQKHVPIITRHFNLYAGAGLHKGWLDSSEAEVTDPFGLTLVAGAEITIGRLNLSYDFKPAINLTGGSKTLYSQTAVSLRYVLLKDNFIKKIKRKQKRKQRQKERVKNGGFDWKFWD